MMRARFLPLQKHVGLEISPLNGRSWLPISSTDMATRLQIPIAIAAPARFWLIESA
jgi:hypothetical protein